ncbi:MAG: hypothetical protein QOE45_1837 [Frankiaceae bacterium]|jgi:hypothetical protein|nr:hypothetical protein [Frankiaceae bacterium]
MNARPLRWGVAATIVAGFLAGAPGAVGAPVPALAGTTVIRASRPVSADVRLARTATVATPFGASPDLTVTAGGRLAVFALVGTGPATKAVTVVGGATGSARFLLPLPQFPAPGGGTFQEVKTFADVTSLPAGPYRLYVVPDGGTVQVTLRLHGLAGRVAIAPARPATAEIASPDPWPADSPARTSAFLGAVTRRLAGRGLALQVLRSQIQATAAWQLVMCHNNPSAPDPVRTAPGCPEGEKHTLVDHRYPDPGAGARLFVQGFAGLPAGDHGVSAVYTTEGVATTLDYVTLWLTY